MNLTGRFATLAVSALLAGASLQAAETSPSFTEFKHEVFTAKLPKTLQQKESIEKGVFVFSETGTEIRLIAHDSALTKGIIEDLAPKLLKQTRFKFDSTGYSNISESLVKDFDAGRYSGKFFTLSGNSSKKFSMSHYLFAVNDRVFSLIITTGSTAADTAREYPKSIISNITANK